jgi:acetyl esterase/lipase
VTSLTEITLRAQKLPHIFIVCLFLSVMLMGCSPLGALNTFVSESNVVIKRDIRYGAHQRQQLDVVQKKSTAVSPTKRPVIVFFYGGAWESGDKANYFFMAEALASRGYVVVVPDYRLYPEVVFPAFMDDAALAVKWTLESVSQYGGDANNIFVMGHSAGAQIAALLAYDNTYLSRLGLSKNLFKGMVSLAGPMDFLPLTEPTLFKIFPENVRAASQPINFITGSESPSLLMHGEADTRVGLHNTRNLAQRIRARGGEVETTTYPDVSHAGILLAFAAPLRDNKPQLERVSAFINQLASLDKPYVPVNVQPTTKTLN